MLSRLFARFVGKKIERTEKPPSLESVIQDALNRHDLPCILRVAPDVSGKLDPMRRIQLAERVYDTFGLDGLNQYSEAVDRASAQGWLEATAGQGARGAK